MNSANSLVPLVNPLVTATAAAAATAIALTTPTATVNVTEASSASLAASAGGSDDNWLNTIAAALSLESVVHVSSDTLIFISNVTKDSTFAALGVISTVTALRTCLNDGFVSVDAVIALSCGLSAATALDRVVTASIGIGLGIGRFGFITGGMVTVATMMNRARQGDIPGTILSGTKLLATVALTGHPVALGIVIAADVTYGVYCAYCAYYAGSSESSLPPSLIEDPYPGSLKDVLLPIFAKRPVG